MYKICEKRKCCGCGLCSVQCPVQAIRMSPDEEGFYYPVINQNICISCGRCESVCPVLKYDKVAFFDSIDRKNGRYPLAYSAYKKDIKELLRSSAGGVANSIGKSFIKSGGVVFGVRYKEDYRGAEYALARDINEIEAFNESKYVESDRNKLFEYIVNEIRRKKVLVIGLPCDIAAVRSLVGNPDNLYTCRLICRSNTSGKALNEFIDRCESEASSTVSRLSLRYKEVGRPTLPTRYKIEFKNGSVRTGDFTKSDYGKAFQIFARPSCLSCFAKHGNVSADITVGDFQGLNPNDELYKVNGVSLVYCFTDKGNELIKNTPDLCIENVDYESTWKYNWMIYTAIPESPFRKSFSERFTRNGLRAACHELCVKQNEILDSLQGEYMDTGKPVAIWGAGDTAEYLYERLNMDRWNISRVFDGSKMKHGKLFKTHVIEDITKVGEFSDKIDALILMIPSENEEKLEKLLKNYGYFGKLIHVGKYKFYREET